METFVIESVKEFRLENLVNLTLTEEEKRSLTGTFEELEGYDLVGYVVANSYELESTYVKAILRSLMTIGTRINVYSDGDNIFHVLARYGRDEFVDEIDALYYSGHEIAEVNARDRNGDLPLHLVRLPRQKGIYQWLIKVGANPYLFNSKGYNFLGVVYTRTGRQTPLSMFEHVEGRVDIEGNSLLHLAIDLIRNDRDRFLYNELRPKLKTLLDVTNRHLVTPLMLACKYGQTDIVKELIDAGADVNLEDEDRNTCLHFASNKQVVDLLVKNGLSPTSKNRFGKTPLDCAIDKALFEYGSWNLVRHYVFDLKVKVTDEEYALLDPDIRVRLPIDEPMDDLAINAFRIVYILRAPTKFWFRLLYLNDDDIRTIANVADLYGLKVNATDQASFLSSLAMQLFGAREKEIVIRSFALCLGIVTQTYNPGEIRRERKDKVKLTYTDS
jgi:hypothetical protein